MSFRWIALPARKPTFAVMSNVQVESLMRPASDSALKPPKTIEWIAPTRAQASIATGNSGTIGM